MTPTFGVYHELTGLKEQKGIPLGIRIGVSSFAEERVQYTMETSLKLGCGH